MDILDQVNEVVSDFEKREQPNREETSLAEVLALTKLVVLHNRYVSDRQWDAARECLKAIARLTNHMLASS